MFPALNEYRPVNNTKPFDYMIHWFASIVWIETWKVPFDIRSIALSLSSTVLKFWRK